MSNTGPSKPNGLNNPNLAHNTDLSSSKVKIIKEVTHWMKFNNKTFQTQDNFTGNAVKSPGFSYRQINYTGEETQNKNLLGEKIFFDPEWDVRATQDLEALQSQKYGKVVLRRLSHLYPSNKELKPKFFPPNNFNQPLRKVQDARKVPHFLHQMGLFQSSDFRSLFFTQDFQPAGLYYAVVNYNGRWQTDVVDDIIPVYEQSGKPLWGMDLEQPWQLILLKFWAKRNYISAKQNGYDLKTNGGYQGVRNSPPFQFIYCFSNNTWKYVNLSIDAESFLRNNNYRVHKAHYILKTKNSQHVRDSGLIPNEACYELVNLAEEEKARSLSGIKTSTSGVKSQSKKKTHYVVTIRSSEKTSWTGKNSVLDAEFKNIHKGVLSEYKSSSKLIEQKTVNDQRSEIFGLDRYFTVTGQDLKNLFSCCYITPRRLGSDFVSGYFKFTIPAGRTNAFYIQFNISHQTFFDFSIKQLPSNKIAPKSQSKVLIQKYHKEQGITNTKIQRFLTNKYILVKDNSASEATPAQIQFEKDYNRLHYQTYEIQYLKGYNSGDAHCLTVVPGRYILRLKSQTLNRDAHYVLNYCSEAQLYFKQVTLDKVQQTKLMVDAMSSTMDKVSRVNLRPKIDDELVAYGKLFDYVGYGYVGVKIKKNSKSQILIDVDPKMLKEEGYRLKHLYKNQQQPFAIVVKPGEAMSVVLKLISPGHQVLWPPKGIAIFHK